MTKIRHDEDGKGIQTDREGTRYTRKESSDQNSPKLKALQACISDKTDGKDADSRSEWQEIFSNASKACKEELSDF